MTCIHYYSITQNSFTVQEMPPSVPPRTCDNHWSCCLSTPFAFLTPGWKISASGKGGLGDRGRETAGRSRPWLLELPPGTGLGHVPYQVGMSLAGKYAPPTGSYRNGAASGDVQFSSWEQGNKQWGNNNIVYHTISAPALATQFSTNNHSIQL